MVFCEEPSGWQGMRVTSPMAATSVRPSGVAIIQGKLESYRLKHIEKAKHNIHYLEHAFHQCCSQMS